MQVRRYIFGVAFDFTVDLPKGANIVHLGLQRGARGEVLPFIWAIVDPGASIVTRRFHAVKSGEGLPNYPLTYLGTLQHGVRAWHIFQVVE